MASNVLQKDIGELVWAKDKLGFWSLATITAKPSAGFVNVHFINFCEKDNETVSVADCVRHCQLRTTTVHNGKYNYTTGVQDIISIDKPPTPVERTVHQAWLRKVLTNIAESHDVEIRFLSTLCDTPVIIKTNKWLLSCHCDYFATRFNSQFQDSEPSCIDVNFDYTSPSVIIAWSKYIKQGNCALVATLFAELYQLADMLRCDTLTKFLEQMDFTPFSAAVILTLCERVEYLLPLHPNLKSWMDACVFYAQKHLPELVMQANEKQITLVKRLKEEAKSVDESRWWDLIQPWIIRVCTEASTAKTKASALIQQLVDLTCLPAKDKLCMDPALLKILTGTYELTGPV
jgi:hypothetical protein